ncbi:fucosyltransferase, partial [Helicobacter pylori]|nr:fucosyltransferase [Helicobacter pylori]
LSFKKILDFFKTILENDTIYHDNPFIFYRDLHEPLVTIDDLRADYDRLLQNASPLLELSQNTTFKTYRKAYQKFLPLLRAIRRWVKKLGL